MSEQDLPEATMTDMVFSLAGRSLPRDHAQALQQALQQALPWLADEPLAGIHAVKLVHGSGAQALLSQRARLLLRLPNRCVQPAAALTGRMLDVAGCPVQVGAAYCRALLPYATLYAHAVAAPSESEADFVNLVSAEVHKLQLRSQWVCGKRHSRQVQGQPMTTFSLMLHGLSLADSLRVLESGLGPHRQLGCGIFVPHRSAAAVGE
jgi:CRISPR-associated protein Cas6